MFGPLALAHLPFPTSAAGSPGRRRGALERGQESAWDGPLEWRQKFWAADVVV